MGRKRCSSIVESSEDEFELSEADASPVFSRLKRPRRASTRDGGGSGASPERNSFQLEDDGNSSVVIPDSLDQDDKSNLEPIINSEPQTPKDPRDEDTRETEGPSEKGDKSDADQGEEDDEDLFDVEEGDPNHEKHSLQCSRNDVETAVKTESAGTSRRRGQARKVYRVDSDSGEESSSNGHNDDDAYNSAEDSPPEDDDDSEFDFSPKKSTKKKEKTPAKRAPTYAKKENPSTRRLATRKLATRKLTTMEGNTTSKASPVVKASSKSSTTADGVKRRLGARLPHQGLLSTKSPASGRQRPLSTGKLPSTPVIRSGLSRKAAVPRLHAYLPR